ncbi:hypothetical protein QL285_011117 [Trifolium repens]|nr:hypothetical protein QL285_011117 [Trifolium repens]
MCNICSSSFHISDACPILLDTAFCGENQFVGNFQGQYYQEQNSYLAEQPIWSHPQFQQLDSLVVEPQLSLEELIKQMDENHKQRDEQIQSSLQSLAVQVEQIVSTAHQLQEKKMFHDDVQPVALLEVMQCDTSLDETPGLPYVHAIPPKPPDFSLISKFTCYLLFLIPRVRSLERPPRKPPDI